MSIHPNGLIVAACVLSLCAAASIAFADDHRPPATQPAPTPAPQLSPGQVVKVIMSALQANDATDSGIRTTFAFASPSNQQVTGPIDRFIPMVKGPGYAQLLNHKGATVKELGMKGDQAMEMVTVIDAAGNIAHYVFQLSKQRDAGPLKDCWMTDGVIRVRPKGGDEVAA